MLSSLLDLSPGQNWVWLVWYDLYLFCLFSWWGWLWNGNENICCRLCTRLIKTTSCTLTYTMVGMTWSRKMCLCDKELWKLEFLLNNMNQEIATILIKKDRRESYLQCGTQAVRRVFSSDKYSVVNDSKLLSIPLSVYSFICCFGLNSQLPVLNSHFCSLGLENNLRSFVSSAEMQGWALWWLAMWELCSTWEPAPCTGSMLVHLLVSYVTGPSVLPFPWC